MRRCLLLTAAAAGAVALAAAAARGATLPPLPSLLPTLPTVPQVPPVGSALPLPVPLPLPPGTSTTTTGGWRPTATQGLALKGTNLGALDGSTPLHISVALQMRNAAALQQSIASGTQMTSAQFAATYGASDADAQAVVNYLQSKGFTNIAIEPNRLFVTGNATAVQAESAFDTSLSRWNVGGATLFANSTPAKVPANLSAPIAVLGLNDAAKMNVPHRKADTGIPNYLTSYTPQGFWQAYDATGTPTGAKTPIAIFAEGDLSGVVTDLRTAESANGVPRVPVQVVQVGLHSPDTVDAGEWDLDTQSSTGMAESVSKLYIYDTTSLTDSDTTLEFSRFASDNLARAGSASFGECEYQAYLDGSMVAEDQVFNEAAAQGQTVFASSGDTGGFCPVAPTNGAPAGIPDVNYPASSPYVVSVGGTTLLTNADGSYDQEAAWVAGGGGPSLFEYQPYWQGGVAPPTGSACVETLACAGKTVPDVAMDADPESGASVYVGGTPEGIGGTSLASPLTLGVWARLESAHGNALGFAAPDLYAANGTAGFHDIVLGDTGPYPATPGYDLATGMGTFDVAQMQATIAAPGTAAATPLPSPACTLFTDPAGDAKPLGSTGNVDSLDILAGGFLNDGANVTGELLVKSLSDGPGGMPAIAGAGDVWYVIWTSGGTQYFLQAEFPGSTVDPNSPGVPVKYSYGDIVTSPTGGNEFKTVGSATGSLDTTTGVISISAPASAFGLSAHATLGNPSGQTYESVGTPVTGGLLEPADNAGPGSAYTLGTGCSGSSSHGGGGSGGGSHDDSGANPNSASGTASSSSGASSGTTTTASPSPTSSAAGTSTTDSTSPTTAPSSTATGSTSGVAGTQMTKVHTVSAHGTVNATGTFSIGPGNNVVYIDHARRLSFHSLRILTVRYGTHSVIIAGLGNANGRTVHFTAIAIDSGSAGDLFRITWTHGGTHGGIVAHGSISIH